MMYGEKVNYDEAKYTGEYHEIEKRQSGFSPEQQAYLNNLYKGFQSFIDGMDLLTTPETVSTEGTTTTYLDVSTPQDVTVGLQSRDEVYYKAEVGYCYHLGIFGAVVGFMSCGLSFYQSWRDMQVSNGIQRL